MGTREANLEILSDYIHDQYAGKVFQPKAKIHYIHSLINKVSVGVLKNCIYGVLKKKNI